MDPLHSGALRFVERWIIDTIHRNARPVTRPDDPRPARLAARCRADAAATGLTERALDATYCDLPERMRQALTGGA